MMINANSCLPRILQKWNLVFYWILSVESVQRLYHSKSHLGQFVSLELYAYCLEIKHSIMNNVHSDQLAMG